MRLDLLLEKLSKYSPRKLRDSVDKRAGVVVPIYESEEPKVILTKRTEKVRLHKGEVSFPGGTCEKEDKNTQMAAVRECFEEIGVKSEDLRIVGRLDDIYTITGYLVTPYVGIIPYPYDFKINEEEVDYLIFLPLKTLLDPSFDRMGDCLIYNGDRIFGATYRILRNLRNLIVSS